MNDRRCVVWLEWPERCFRVDSAALRRLKDLAPAGTSVVRVRSERAFLRALPRATHAIVWQFNADWFARAPRLRLLATPAAGREFVPEHGPKGVRIHFGTFHGPIIAESVAAFVLGWARGFFALQAHRAHEKADVWPRIWMSDKCAHVAGTHAVVVGFGHIGRAIGAKLEALGVTVTGWTRHGVFRGSNARRPFATICPNETLAAADWFILALPSTAGTDNFLDARLLARLPRRCAVVNIGRGNAIDEGALYRALSSGHLAGAYLDVRKHEPSATVLESPGFDHRLDELPNCFVTPHASAFDEMYMRLCFEELAREGLLA